MRQKGTEKASERRAKGSRKGAELQGLYSRFGLVNCEQKWLDQWKAKVFIYVRVQPEVEVQRYN